MESWVGIDDQSKHMYLEKSLEITTMSVAIPCICPIKILSRPMLIQTAVAQLQDQKIPKFSQKKRRFLF